MRARLRWTIPTFAIALGVAQNSALAEGVPVTQATDDQKAQATALFQRAQDKEKAGDHEGALADLRGSFDVVASPNTRLLIMRSLVSMGRFAEAYREAAATERLAQEAAQADPKYEETYKSVQAERAELNKKVGFVKVDVAGRGGELVVGGRAVAADEKDSPIPANPGQVEVLLRDSRGVVDTKVVDVKAGAESSVSFAPPVPQKPVETTPAPSTSGSMSPFDMGTGQRITGIVFAGVGVVGMGLFAGFGAASQSTFSDLEDQCPNGRCPASLQEDADQGRSFQTAANVSVAIGAIGLAAGAALIIPTFFAGDDKKTAWTNLQVGAGYLGYKGEF
ncbi:MAG: hypothetical protein HOW73_23450 [Polyangiaceae bacterium]|nr:hypothetical protein [Polyangiaceae bacterium]